jgi:hypothetical protein
MYSIIFRYNEQCTDKLWKLNNSKLASQLKVEIKEIVAHMPHDLIIYTTHGFPPKE